MIRFIYIIADTLIVTNKNNYLYIDKTVKTFPVIIFFLDVYYILIHNYGNNMNLNIRRNKAP